MLPSNLSRVLKHVLGRKGRIASIRIAAADRAAAAAGVDRPDHEIPDNVRPYIDKLIEAPYKIVDRDIDALKAANYSEDEIFELTIATALGAGTGRFEKVLRLLDQQSSRGR